MLGGVGKANKISLKYLTTSSILMLGQQLNFAEKVYISTFKFSLTMIYSLQRCGTWDQIQRKICEKISLYKGSLRWKLEASLPPPSSPPLYEPHHHHCGHYSNHHNSHLDRYHHQERQQPRETENATNISEKRGNKIIKRNTTTKTMRKHQQEES